MTGVFVRSRSAVTAFGVVAAVFLASCGGSSSSTPSRYGGCNSDGATAQDKSGVGLKCSKNSAGELMWDVDASATESSSGSENSTAVALPLKEVFGGECDEKGPTKYSTGFGDAEKMSYIVPLGAMISTHITPVDHIYVYFPNGSDGSAKGTYTVTAPADGTVITVEDFQLTNKYPYADYRVVLQHSCDLYSVFIHVGELQGKLADAAREAKANGGSWSGSIPVSAGDVVADDSEKPGYDFSTFASSAKQDMLNPSSYLQKESWKPYTANPFDFVTADLKSAYEAKTLRTSSPIGGTIFFDKKDTAQGSWFVKGTNGYKGLGDQQASYENQGKVARGYWDTHLSLAPEHVDASAFIYSIGDWEGCPCQFMSVGNIDPSSIAVSSTPTVIDLVNFEYLTPNGSKMDRQNPSRGYKLKAGSKVIGSLAIQVNDDGSMTVEKRLNEPASSFTAFSKEAKTYVR